MVERFPGYTREELLAYILCREVSVNGETVPDPKRMFKDPGTITISSEPYVSRGGKKLAHALDAWGIDVTGKVFIDAGSSTGGFTDCLLQHGAKAVHAVDVGYNQLSYALRVNPRVHVLERTNIMDVVWEQLEPRPQAAVADLSFRSIQGAATHILGLAEEGWAIALIKPQFELRATGGGTPPKDFHGVINDRATLLHVLGSVLEGLRDEGVIVSRMIESPITGHSGNREFLAYLMKGEAGVRTVPRITPEELMHMVNTTEHTS